MSRLACLHSHRKCCHHLWHDAFNCVREDQHLTHTALCITRRPPPATSPASIWPLIGPHWSWMSACPPRVIHSVLVTGTKPGLYLTWFESLIPGQGRRYFSSQPGLMVQNHSFKVHFIENDKSFKHFCEYQGEPGGKEQGDYNLPHNPRHHGYDPDEPKNDQASKCVRSKVMLLKLQIILRTSLSVSTFYIYTCDYLHVLDKKNVALGETVKFKLKSQQYL